MRIGFFTATYYPTPDGVSHYLRDVKAELQKRGHEVHVFSFNGDRKEKNVHVLHSVPFPAYSQYSVPVNPLPFGLYRKAIRLNLDIIHIHDPFMGSLGYRISRYTGAPVVATYHTDFVKMQESIKIPFRDRLFRTTWKYSLFLYRRCDEVFAPSRKSMEQLRNDGVLHTRELPLFVDTGRFAPDTGDTGTFFVQYIGRLTRDKGVFRILDVAAAIDRKSGIRFLISGTGPEEKNLEKAIQERGLQDIITLTGYVDEPRKIELLRRAGLFMYPSETDTFGISVVEAMSSGVPSIVPRGFPLAHYDDMEVSGLIEMDFSKPDEIAQAVEKYSTEGQNLRAMGEAARKFVLDNFSMERHCDILLSTYTDLLSERSVNAVSGDRKSTGRLFAR
ncbi:MAG: glycosyltransferase [Thermoplasmataceae archaeon]